MNIFKNSKNYLELTGKDSTLLGITVILLFIENIYHYSEGNSLVRSLDIQFNQLFQFKFLFGFIVFVFACKFLFFLFNPIINQVITFYKIDISVSYKIGFGCFLIAILLFFHTWISDESNLFLAALPKNSYKAVCFLLGLFALLIASLSDWSSDRK